MVGLTDLSDTDDSLIDEIISQAQDACILHQLSAINGASFTDSVLPTHLESRFRNLKSFPPTKPNRNTTAPLPPYQPKAHNFSPSKEHPHEKTCFDLDPKLQPSGGYVSPPSDSSPVKGKKGFKPKSKHGSGSDSSPASEESSMSSLFKPNLDERKRLKQKPKSGSLCSPLSTSNSFMGSPSPPRKTGCFWCSPKKDSSKKKKKKSKENWGVVGWDNKSDELLSDLGSFSSKRHQKILKKAMKEEEKISREAEKIVQWAKQASARMNVLDIEDELSDH